MKLIQVLFLLKIKYLLNIRDLINKKWYTKIDKSFFDIQFYKKKFLY